MAKAVQTEASQSRRDRLRQRQAWLAERRAIAQEIGQRAALSGDEATHLTDAAARFPFSQQHRF
jgi:hypothetical protein